MMEGAQATVSPTNPICVISIGATTAVGLDSASSAAAVSAGIDGFEEHAFMINRQGEPYMLASVPSIDPALRGAKRFAELASFAIDEVLEPLTNIKNSKFVITPLIAFPEKRPGLPEDLDTYIDRFIASKNSNSIHFTQTRASFMGHALGLMAVQSAMEMLASRQTEFCLVGGIDSYIDPDTLDWIEDNDQLHNPVNAWGFMPGEAAGFCLLCTESTANKYQFSVLAQVVSAATALESNKIKTETICIGEGLTLSLRAAIEAGLPEEAKIDNMICDQNGETYRADEFGFTLCRVGKYFTDPSDFLAPADCWGDVGAASGPLFIVLLVISAEKGLTKGPFSLLWASSEGGQRSALLLFTRGEV